MTYFTGNSSKYKTLSDIGDFNQNASDNADCVFGKNETDPSIILKNLKIKNINRLIIGHLNINSVRGKFESLKTIIQGNIDVLIITESKLDQSFSMNMFDIEGYRSPFRRDTSIYSGGVLIYVKEGIPCRELKTKPGTEISDSIFLEINLRSKKWLLFGGYNNRKSNISTYLKNIGSTLDHYICKLDNFVLLGDYNSEVRENAMKEFCDTYNLKNLITEATCFKNPCNPSSVDVILTNRGRSFTNSITVETGLSDHHKLTITVLKTYVSKQVPMVIKYRDYRKFNSQNFKYDLQTSISKITDETCYDDFESNFKELLNKHAPIKTKNVRANNAPFMNKTLSKAIMTRSRLKRIFNSNPSEINKYIYKQQINFCVNLTRRVKKNYYTNIDINNVNDNKTFWDTIKPCFSDKNITKKKINLIENDIIISEDIAVAETLNAFFSKTIELSNTEYDTETLFDVNQIVDKFKNHPSILKIKEKATCKNMFSFALSTLDDMKKCINQLNTNKPTTYNNIPAKILIEFSDVCAGLIHNFYNNSILQGTFPDAMKFADITPSHKKNDKCFKENYRPISILSSFSKNFEIIMYNDIYLYMENRLSPYLCGFRKGYSTQYCLMAMLERFRKALDNKQKFGALLTDLSKAFDCLNHELLIAKLAAYGFDILSLNLILSYLKGRKHRTKVNNFFSEWADIVSGVPQGSILGPLLFNIYINDIFLFTQEDRVANYADDTTPYAIESNYVELLETLHLDSQILLKWFNVNFFKLNAEKCKLLISSKDSGLSLEIGGGTVTCEKSVKLLGIKIDNQLTYSEHISSICKKVSLKLHALARVSYLMGKDKLRLLMKAFIESQFSYCSLIWMFHTRTLNNRINNLHERSLRIVYKDHQSSFEKLLILDKSFSIHDRNLQKLATEMYKIKNNLTPIFMHSIFPEAHSTYNLRKKPLFKTDNIHTTYYGTETLMYRGPKTWELVPKVIKEANTLKEFKIKIKSWKPVGCTCRMCKVYIANLGFI